MGAIDIGGVPRFGPQLSADVRLRQSVVSGQYDVMQARGRHYLKVGALVEHYVDNESNPTFSLGVFRFAGIEQFLRNRPASFIGLTPEGDINREWKWTLIGAVRAGRLAGRARRHGQSRACASKPPPCRRIRATSGCRICSASRLPARCTTILAAPGRRAWAASGTCSAAAGTAVRGGYGLYFNTNNHQNLIVTVTNPPATPRVVIINPTFPVPPFERAGGISVRPIQTDVQYPRVHMWNLTVQHEFAPGWALTVGYAGARGKHLWRNSDVNVPEPPTPCRWLAVLPIRAAPAQHQFFSDRAEVQ